MISGDMCSPALYGAHQAPQSVALLQRMQVAQTDQDNKKIGKTVFPIGQHLHTCRAAVASNLCTRLGMADDI
jgi:hypothetical protein